MKQLRFIQSASLMLWFATGIAGYGQSVVNGNFELGDDPGIDTNVDAPNNSAITGSLVQKGSIDYIGSRWAAGEGLRCIYLSGTGAGTISQTISGFVPGDRYQLRFLMAGDPELLGPLPPTNSLRAVIGDTSQDFSFNAKGRSPTTMGWELR